MKNEIQKKTIASAVMGNFIEAYDITNFLFLSPLIAFHFFEAGDAQHNLINIFGIFLLGFLARPLGGIALGLIADIKGRKRSLVISILLASVSTTCIVFIPSYHDIGLLATICLILCRIIQSFALGGEYITSVAFLVEHAPENLKGFVGSWAAFGANCGVFLASLMSAGVTYLMTQHVGPAWLWRIPFLISLIGVFVSYWIRMNALESLGFVLANSSMEERTPLKLWRDIRRFILSENKVVVLVFGLTLLVASSYYIVFTYTPVYLAAIHKLSNTQGMLIAALSVGLLIILTPLAGRLADKVGRGRILLWSAYGFLVLSYPYFYLLTFAKLSILFLAQCLIVLPAAGLYSTILTYIVELLPLKMRCSLGSFLYSIASSVFGGVAPLMADSLIRVTGSMLAPAYYLMSCAGVAIFIYIYAIKELSSARAEFAK